MGEKHGKLHRLVSGQEEVQNNIKSTCCRPNSLPEAGETVAEMAAMNRQEAIPLKQELLVLFFLKERHEL